MNWLAKRQLVRHPPVAYWIYLGGTILRYGLTQAPSEVHFTLPWLGALVEAVLLLALFYGSAAARRMLIFLDVMSAIAGFVVQGGGSLDATTTAISILALLLAAVLMTPAMRTYTASRT